MASLSPLPLLLAVLLLCGLSGCADRANDAAAVRMLRVEIAALEEQLAAERPELETEQHEWEARVADPANEEAMRKVPAEIRKVLALEPSERSEEQRCAAKRYFRATAPSLAGVRAALERKRNELEALPPGNRPEPAL